MPPTDTDRAAAEAALRALLHALGAPLETDPELRETPARAAAALMDELLDGYHRDPADVLRDGVAASDPGLVVLARVRYHSMCPHHLLPCEGVAALGYLPRGRVVGLGTLVRLLETYAHRLILQEALGQRVAEALVTHLDARGAGVVLRARHSCLGARGERQDAALVVTTAMAGVFATDAVEREGFLRAVESAERGHA